MQFLAHEERDAFQDQADRTSGKRIQNDWDRYAEQMYDPSRNRKAETANLWSIHSADLEASFGPRREIGANDDYFTRFSAIPQCLGSLYCRTPVVLCAPPEWPLMCPACVPRL